MDFSIHLYIMQCHFKTSYIRAFNSDAESLKRHTLYFVTRGPEKTNTNQPIENRKGKERER